LNSAELLEHLRALLGEAQVLTAAADVEPYVHDWRGRYHGTTLAVLRPASTAELAASLRLCAAAGVSIVPQGGNTGLCGGATPGGEDSVLISLTRLRRIRALDVANSTITVEAGCTLAEVQAAAAAVDRLFPLSLASEGSCTIGGNIATNAGGVQVLRYGNMRELVLGLEVVLPDGRIWDGLRGLRKDNSGYDLKQLFIGAEGTLGIVSAAVLKLFPALHSHATAWASVASPAAALELLQLLRSECGERLTAFELIGRQAFELVLAHIPGARAPLASRDGHAPWQVLIEIADSAAAAALDQQLSSVLAQASAQGLLDDAVVASSQAQAQALWALRENISAAQKSAGFSIKHDIAVPLSAIPLFLERAAVQLRARWPDVRIVVFGHVGDGNLHYNLSRPAADNAAFVTEDSVAANRIVYALVAELAGSIAAEHGLGQLKKDEFRRYKSPIEIELMRTLKQAFDPAGRMNPGKLID
jgi:FAD/FMN-containing dehydrogenase